MQQAGPGVVPACCSVRGNSADHAPRCCRLHPFTPRVLGCAAATQREKKRLTEADEERLLGINYGELGWQGACSVWTLPGLAGQSRAVRAIACAAAHV